MALSPELAIYASENDFVQRFLVPLLGRLGFGVVANHHGKSEAGMDLIIGEIDRFAHVRYHGIQAKFEGSIGKAAAHGLVQDGVEALAAPFTHPQTGTPQRISSFYAVNAGTLSDEGRNLFFALLQPKFGDNVRLLEGRDLLALDRSASIRGETTRSVLEGLYLEMRRAQTVDEFLRPFLTAIVESDGHGSYPVVRLRLLAVEAWLANPILLSALPVDEIERFHTYGTAFNRSLDEAGTSPLHTVVSIKGPAQRALQMLPDIAEAASSVASTVARQLAAIGADAII